ncbi:MAG: hypothetical protein U0Q22_12645 [Acidimicrobiales bacterium]
MFTRTRHLPRDRSEEVAQLRRVVGVLGDAAHRDQLVGLVDELVEDAGWNTVTEIRATEELRQVQAQLAEARAEIDEARHAAVLAEIELGEARRQREELAEELRALRSLVRPGMADELIELAARHDRDHPTTPPLLVLRQAARVVRAVG